jgi:hypothetical protein
MGSDGQVRCSSTWTLSGVELILRHAVAPQNKLDRLASPAIATFVAGDADDRETFEQYCNVYVEVRLNGNVSGQSSGLLYHCAHKFQVPGRTWNLKCVDNGRSCFITKMTEARTQLSHVRGDEVVRVFNPSGS